MATRAERAADTRERILQGARRVLAEEGIERLTTRRVAHLAGVSHGMVHYHFADKHDLVLALVEHARRDWVEPLEALVDGAGTPTERARGVIAWMAEPATMEVMRVHLSLFWFALRDDATRERLAGEYRRWRSPFARLFAAVAEERGLAGFDAEAVGEAFASAADGLVQQQALDPEVPTERILSATFDALTR